MAKKLSDFVTVEHGVLQDSVLGLELSINYANDIWTVYST